MCVGAAGVQLPSVLVTFVRLGVTGERRQTVAEHIPEKGAVPRIELKRGSGELEAGLRIAQIARGKSRRFAKQPPVARRAVDAQAIEGECLAEQSLLCVLT